MIIEYFKFFWLYIFYFIGAIIFFIVGVYSEKRNNVKLPFWKKSYYDYLVIAIIGIPLTIWSCMENIGLFPLLLYVGISVLYKILMVKMRKRK